MFSLAIILFWVFVFFINSLSFHAFPENVPIPADSHNKISELSGAASPDIESIEGVSQPRVNFHENDNQFYEFMADMCRSLNKTFFTAYPEIFNEYLRDLTESSYYKDSVRTFYVEYPYMIHCQNTIIEYIVFLQNLPVDSRVSSTLTDYVGALFHTMNDKISLDKDYDFRIFNRMFKVFVQVLDAKLQSIVFSFSRIASSPVLNTLFRNVTVSFADNIFHKVFKTNTTLDGDQLDKLLGVLTSKLRVNVTTDRDFILNVLYKINYNYSNPKFSKPGYYGYRSFNDKLYWNIFSGLIGAFEELFSKIALFIFKFILDDFLEPLIKKFMSIIWSFLPLFNKLVKLLAELLNTLLCFVVNLVYTLDKQLKLFEVLVILFFSLYIFNSIYFGLFLSVMFLLVFDFNRYDQLSLMAEVLDYAYSNSTCKILR